MHYPFFIFFATNIINYLMKMKIYLLYLVKQKYILVNFV